MTVAMRAKLLGEEEPAPAPPATPQQQQAAPPPSDYLKAKFAPATTTLTSTVTAPGLHSAVVFSKSQREQASTQHDEEAKPKHVFTGVTRQVHEWAPAKLLCKRLGVPVPHTGAPGEHQEADEENKQVAAVFAPTQAATQPTGPPPPEDKLPQELLESSETPGMDLFRAIFDTPLPLPEEKEDEEEVQEQQEDGVLEPRQPPPQPHQMQEAQQEAQQQQPMLFPEPPPGFVFQQGSPEHHSHKHEQEHKHSHHHKHRHKHKHKHKH